MLVNVMPNIIDTTMQSIFAKYYFYYFCKGYYLIDGIMHKVIVPKNNDSALTVYDDFGLRLTSTTESLQEKSRRNIVSMLSGAIIASGYINLKGLKNFTIEIPPEFIKGIQDGTFSFDESSKILGNFTPNIRDLDGKLVGQATIKAGINTEAFSSAASNLAMFAMMADMSRKLDLLSESVEDVKIGLKNDRRAEVISGFRDFYTAYTSDPNRTDLKTIAIIALSKMTDGLSKIHFEIDEAANNRHFKKAPKNRFMVLLYGEREFIKYLNRYKHLEGAILDYQRLFALTDIVNFFVNGKEGVMERRDEITNLLNRVITDQLISNEAFLMDKPKENLPLFVLRKQAQERMDYLEKQLPSLFLNCDSDELIIS